MSLNCWLFTVASSFVDGGLMHASDILLHRTKARTWPLRRFTPNRSRLDAGDAVVFYLTKPDCCFAGSAVLKTGPVPLSAGDQKLRTAEPSFEFEVHLTKVSLWSDMIPVQTVVDELELFVKKEHWGGYLAGGVVRLNVQDFKRITSRADRVASP